MPEFDLLIQDCQILLPDFSILPNAIIGVRDGRIALIEANQSDSGSYVSKEIIDGDGKLAMPGFIDAHTHATQQLLRGSVQVCAYAGQIGRPGLQRRQHHTESRRHPDRRGAAHCHILDGFGNGLVSVQVDDFKSGGQHPLVDHLKPLRGCIPFQCPQ